jgi:hypothetical protein
MSGPNILGSASIIDMGGSLLDAGRRINRSGLGMSASSRGLLEGFYNNATALFNQLYNRTENSELSNQVTILALRSKFSYLVTDEVKAGTAAATTVPSSDTTGTNVDTSA